MEMSPYHNQRYPAAASSVSAVSKGSKPTGAVPNVTSLQRVSTTKKKGLTGLAFLCMTIPLMLVAQPAEKKTLMGVWEVEISAGGVPPPPLLSIAIFGADGSFTTSGNTKISLAYPNQGLADERGPGYGRWAQTGDREFKLTFYAVLLKDGQVTGYLQVHSSLILSESGNEFTTRDCEVNFMDVDRKVLDRDTDQVKGTRLETP
jgi:hypothetical protein